MWEAGDGQIDAILAEYGVPSPVEWGKPGSYIQTTTRWQVEANRKKNDAVFIPVGCTELQLARQTDGAAVELPPKQAITPALWRAKNSGIERKIGLPIFPARSAMVRASLRTRW